MNNYDKMLQAAQERCAEFEMAALAAKAGVEDTPEYIKTKFFGQTVLVCKADGAMTVEGRTASFEEALSVYDWLCDRKDNAVESGTYCTVSNLPGVFVGGKGLGMEMPKLARRIHEAPKAFADAMQAMGAEQLSLGDLGFRLEIFPGLSVCLKFYFGDEEFPPKLTLLWDRNMLQFVRYETVYYIAGCLHDRLITLL